MENNNDLINEILKIAYKAVPKKCALDGNKLIEVHNELNELLNQVDNKNSFYCYDKCVRNAAEDFDIPKCKEQCEKCK